MSNDGPGSDCDDAPTSAPGHADDAIIGVAFKWSVLVLIALAIIVVITIFALRRGDAEPVVVERPAVAPPAPLRADAAQRPHVPFTDVTGAAGVAFHHTSGAGGRKLLPETMGGGCAFLDLDADGDQDILLINSMHWPDADQADPPPTAGLYRNDGTGHFTDVTPGSGLDVTLHGTGVACGDYDNDGAVDVFIAALGRNRLFRNVGTRGGMAGGTGGDVRFEETTEEAGVSGAGGSAGGWSTSTGFLDYDGDGLLDLFVCNYVQWTAALDLQLDFTLNGTDRAYGPPKLYPGTFCSLYRNLGGGRFADVSAASGIELVNATSGEPMGKALGVTFADVEGDGDLDILVANDTVQNVVFENEGDGTFQDVGTRSGMAYDSMGSATGAMGIDAADYTNGGGLGVGIGNFANETTSFFVQQRDPWQFADMSNAEGIGSPSRLKLSFGLFFFDYDLDGRLDLLQANGHLEEAINEIQPSQRYRQPAQLFWNRGQEAVPCFAAVPETDMGDLARPIVGRGAAYADIDGDGDLDVLLTQTGGPPLLLRNDQGLDHHWLRLKLVGRDANRDAIGAVVELDAGGVTQRRTVMPTRSYLSQVELPVTFGLGRTDRVEKVRIRWPSGTRQTLDGLPVDEEVVVEEGG